MNNNWYECSIKHRKTTDTGAQKVVTESYLIDALSFTEAEARITEKMSEYISEEFKVSNIKLTNISEVHSFDNSDRWFKAKITLFAYDEATGKEQKSNFYLLAEANDAKDAYDKTVVIMKSTMGEYSIPAITETKILEVFPFFSEEK